MPGRKHVLKHILTWGAFSLCCLYLGGCLDLIRRNPAPREDRESAFTSVQRSEDSSAPEDVRGKEEGASTVAHDTSRSEVVEGSRAEEDTLKILRPKAEVRTVGEDPFNSASGRRAEETGASGRRAGKTAAGEASMDEADAEELRVAQEATEPVAGKEAPRPAVAGAAKIEHFKRSRKHRQEVRQINEYAFWCLEKGLWNEARSHLEQAVERDSLAASLHNNLGIIYERLGLEEKAMAAYGKAWNLSPREKAYRDNLELFERRQQAMPDSAVQIDIIELDAQPEQSPSSDGAVEAQQSIYAGG